MSSENKKKREKSKAKEDRLKGVVLIVKKLSLQDLKVKKKSRTISMFVYFIS